MPDYWGKVPGFRAWFIRVAPNRGNFQLAADILEKFPQVRKISVPQIKSLRTRWQVLQTTETKIKSMARAPKSFWRDQPGFVEWFSKAAVTMTSEELSKAAKEKWPQIYKTSPLTPYRIRTMKHQYGLRMDKETRLRALQVSAHGEHIATPSGQAIMLVQMKRENRELMNKIEQLKIKKQDLVEAVYSAATQALNTLEIKPVPKAPVFLRKKGEDETAIIHFTDWQLAKKTATYSTAVCEERVERYVDKAIRLVNLQRQDHPVTKAKIYLTGDLVEGEMIFPGQSHLIDASLFAQTMVDGPRILGNAVRRLGSHFEHTDVVGVIGNHGALGGRARRDYHPESNADAMMYEVTKKVILLTDGDRISWSSNVKTLERNWYAVDYIGEKGFLLFHGDQVKGGFAGFPWYGFAKKVQGWHMGAIPERFHYALAGHFHTPTRMLIGRVVLWVGGSTESDNTYAAEQLAAQGTPSQWLLFSHPRHGVTAEYQVHLGAGLYDDAPLRRDGEG